MVLLDTDHMSILEWTDSLPAQRLLTRLDALAPDQVTSSIISFEEQIRGWMAAAAKARTVAKQVEVIGACTANSSTIVAFGFLNLTSRPRFDFNRFGNIAFALG
ncbi:hypothetical protein AYO44_08955 [Planctomycetaceae bacterium SCGC AG-212-F19]|nr:hypothetical protein AYO44_08955 [Planctomycetaceae bacterium SCGC AG-212-F19]